MKNEKKESSQEQREELIRALYPKSFALSGISNFNCLSYRNIEKSRYDKPKAIEYKSPF